MMPDRPILFSAPMVRAILEGRKTQTRRIVKPQPTQDEFGFWSNDDIHHSGSVELWVENVPLREKAYAHVGDRLWVRETCQAEELDDNCEHPGLDGVRYAADGHFRPIENSIEASEQWSALRHYGGAPSLPGSGLWRKVPSIHMPRWASRITLEVVGVRVERLQDISEADATAEGTPHSLHLAAGRTAIGNYEHLWECINGDGSWNVNPWVWCITFLRVTC